jgi:acetyltransferase-like isoleucine patch superfamily enzyme
MLIKFVALLYKNIKKSEFSVHEDLTTQSVGSFLFKKGFWPFLRGLMMSSIHSNIRFPFFRGERITFIGAHNLSTGPRCFIGHSSHIDCTSLDGITLGNKVTIREYAWIQLTSNLNTPGDSLVIGDDTYIGPFAKIGAAAKVTIGRQCQFGPSLTLIAEEHDFDPGDLIINQGVSRAGISIGDDCWFGTGVTVLDGVTVGRGCVIGANSLVTKDIADFSVAVGSPARVIRSRAPES